VLWSTKYIDVICTVWFTYKSGVTVHNLHTHPHDQGGHVHYHETRLLAKKRLWIALAINAVFFTLEVVGGIVSHSLALLADAGHMLTDVAALVLAIFVATLAERAPTPRRTFGLLRAEVLGAFINGAALMFIVVLIFREAWHRFSETPEINAPLMLFIAFLGLFANVLSAWVLFESRLDNVNIRGAFLHMSADALGSVGAITAGIIVWITGWMPADPIASIVIGILILWGSWGLITQTMNILLEATPEDIDYHEVEQALLDIDHVTGIHDLHIWTITSGIPSLSAHISLEPECSNTTHWQQCLKSAQNMLKQRFGIEHSTLQLEPQDYERDNRRI